MEELRRQLAALDADQVRQLLSASGHDILVTEEKRPVVDGARLDRGEISDTIDVAVTKAEGNAAFKRGQFEAAVDAYTRCIGASSEADATLYSNRAMANLKLERYEPVVDDCTRAIEIAPSIKVRLRGVLSHFSYLRRATAYEALLKLSLAVKDLESALGLEPSNRDALRLLEKVLHSPTADRCTRTRASLLIAFRDGWRSVPVKGNPTPPALNGHALFTVPSDPSQSVFLYGGRSVRDQKLGVFMMDGADYSWELASSSNSSPSSRAWHTVSPLTGDLLCVYGGVSAQGEDPTVHVLGAVESLRGCHFEWRGDFTTTPGSLLPTARSGHSSVSRRTQREAYDVFVFGGRTKGGVSDELWILRVVDPRAQTLEWTLVEPANKPRPTGRDGHSMVIREKGDGVTELVLFGGNGQLTEEKLNDLWVFDPQSGEWAELHCEGEIPTPRSYHSAHIVEGFMVIIGGRTVDSEDSNVYLLDFETKTWFRLPIPVKATMVPRAWHASILHKRGDEIYVLGGGTFHGPSRDAAVLDLAKFRAIASDLQR